MPPVVIAAGIAAGGAIYGAHKAAGAQKDATNAQMDATNQALAFQREQAAKAEAAYAAEWERWNASRDALLKRYGIDIAPPTMPSPVANAGASGAAGTAPGAVPRAGMVPGVMDAKGLPYGQSLGQLAQSGSGPGAWNDWSTMGLGRSRGGPVA